VDLDLRIDPSCVPDADLKVEIQTTSAGKPTGTVLAGTSLSPSSVPLALSFVPIHFLSCRACERGHAVRDRFLDSSLGLQ
jgi:hypothetical protein